MAVEKYQVQGDHFDISLLGLKDVVSVQGRNWNRTDLGQAQGQSRSGSARIGHQSLNYVPKIETQGKYFLIENIRFWG